MKQCNWRIGSRVIVRGAFKHSDGAPRLVRGTVRQHSPAARGGFGLVVVKLDDFSKCREYMVRDLDDEPIIDQIASLVDGG